MEHLSEFASIEELNSLSKAEYEELEILSKSCPRCGKSSANKSNPQGRCRSCLKKLKTAKHTPGTYQRAHMKADDALRRQKGKNGTAHKKSKGLGTRDSIVKQTQSAEKKTGQKLSPDRKNNAHGYAAKNTRMVPEKLNRGRHKVDPKKLANWKKRLKKYNIEPEDFMTLLRAKAFEAGNETLEKSLNVLDIERLLSYLPFKETEDEKLEKVQEEVNDLIKGLKEQVGTTHTVEVHPDVDNMLRAKNFIQDSGKDKIHISGFKKSGVPSNIIDKLPRDDRGFISPDMIDSHINYLPKSKIDVDVLPYAANGQQKHRRGNPEYVLSMKMHPEEKANMGMDDRDKLAWNHMKTQQHRWGGTNHDSDQIGWVRVDPHKNTPEGPKEHDHWHLDEIQSDFQNKKKIKKILAYSPDSDIENMLGRISHNHEDPQHLLHSVANALGRKLGVKSTSMDMPEDQAKKSQLTGYRQAATGANRRWINAPEHRTFNGWNQAVDNHINRDGLPEEHKDAVWSRYGEKLLNEHKSEDPDFKSAADKLGPEKLREFAELANKKTSGFAFNGESDDGWDNPESDVSPDLAKKLKSMSGDEKNALSSFLLKHSGNVQSHIAEIHGFGDRPAEDAPTGWWSDEYAPEEHKEDKKPLPVHQINTYGKRPKKLGMEPTDKDSILGSSPNDKAKQVQYGKLYKNLETISAILAELKKNQ